MRAFGVTALVALALSGCGAHHPIGAPSMAASKAAARRFTLVRHPVARDLTVTCGPTSYDHSRGCAAFFADGCEAYTVRFDLQGRARVVRAVEATCFKGGPSGSIPAG